MANLGTPGRADVVVVGGGLAGLTAAAYVARAGRSVVVLERGETPGGRARSRTDREFVLNQGPHALYRAGAGRRVLHELGVPVRGRVPPARGLALREGRAYRLPVGPASLALTGLLGAGAKLETARLLASLSSVDVSGLHGLTLRKWIDERLARPESRAFLHAVFRVATYTNEPDRLSAGAAVEQVRLATRASVLYLDRGWQSLVDGLLAAGAAAGAVVEQRQHVVRLEADGDGWAVHLDNGKTWRARDVIVGTPPRTAASLIGRDRAPALHAWAANAVPVRAACLDLGLATLPRRHRTFALGIDRPLYFSDHSATALLAPAGASLVHAALYLGDSQADAGEVERELEALVDRMRPGWRDVVTVRRFLPEMTVAHALPTAAGGGTAGRPSPVVPGLPGLSLAGDWVGGEGLLADAAFASAREAARAALAHLAALPEEGSAPKAERFLARRAGSTPARAIERTHAEPKGPHSGSRSA